MVKSFYISTNQRPGVRDNEFTILVIDCHLYNVNLTSRGKSKAMHITRSNKCVVKNPRQEDVRVPDEGLPMNPEDLGHTGVLELWSRSINFTGNSLTYRA